MAGLKEIRTRIATVKTTRQVTNAMKMVSAARLKKAQDAIMQFRPYAEKMHHLLTLLRANMENTDDSVFTRPGKGKKVLMVLISSNRGLCGGFNINITRKAADRVQDAYPYLIDEGNVDFLAIGKQGEHQLKHYGCNMKENRNELYNNLNFENVSLVASEIMESFATGEYSCVELVYNSFQNAAVQELTIEQFLPVEINGDEKQEVRFDLIYEPSKAYIVQELIPRILKIQFYKAMLDSHASEHGARMTAMHLATDNATELLKELNLAYNKARQASITNELLEIVSGAEALKG
jgi:F-type H+-transporting ATPase subunit gamma